MSNEIIIGEWTFLTREAALLRSGDRRRLEHRASQALEHLCKKGGDVVSHAELVEAVWQGRSLSPNSVAVVIADLRRALEDDARTSKYIETIPKRGYRMAAPVTFRQAAPPPLEPVRARFFLVALVQQRRTALAAAVAALLVFAVFGLMQMTASADVDRTTVMLGAFVNETNAKSYDALTRSVTELTKTELARLSQVRILTRDGARADIIVRGSLILWDGHPSLALYAESPKDGSVLWSGMASGPETELPEQVRAEFAKLSAAIAPSEPQRSPAGR